MKVNLGRIIRWSRHIDAEQMVKVGFGVGRGGKASWGKNTCHSKNGTIKKSQFRQNNEEQNTNPGGGTKRTKRKKSKKNFGNGPYVVSKQDLGGQNCKGEIGVLAPTISTTREIVGGSQVQ